MPLMIPAFFAASINGIAQAEEASVSFTSLKDELAPGWTVKSKILATSLADSARVMFPVISNLSVPLPSMYPLASNASILARRDASRPAKSVKSLEVFVGGEVSPAAATTPGMSKQANNDRRIDFETFLFIENRSLIYFFKCKSDLRLISAFNLNLNRFSMKNILRPGVI
ncbi:hypothetical protein NYE24_19565 [Paenibacillus sp. FSL H7-0350]|uniref:hypothetical protein n=1 Tax=Paenibacillus sp. FSL H7-0350 TaxID=2975345 RepID=UPI0031592EFE